MRSSVFAIAALLGGLAVSSAEAMPIPAVGTTAAVPVVKVDYACGRGWHVTRWGECRPNRWGTAASALWLGRRISQTATLGLARSSRRLAW
jgi:hypothetical protein